MVKIILCICLLLPLADGSSLVKRGAEESPGTPTDCDSREQFGKFGGVPACGFKVKCSCCSAPSFGECAASYEFQTNQLKGKYFHTLGKMSENVEENMSRVKRDDSADEDKEFDDTAGCGLRYVEYFGPLGHSFECIPGNMATILQFIHKLSKGNCITDYGSKWNKCDLETEEERVYKFLVTLPQSRDLEEVNQAVNHLYELEYGRPKNSSICETFHGRDQTIVCDI